MSQLIPRKDIVIVHLGRPEKSDGGLHLPDKAKQSGVYKVTVLGVGTEVRICKKGDIIITKPVEVYLPQGLFGVDQDTGFIEEKNIIAVVK